jgi:RteC protein.
LKIAIKALYLVELARQVLEWRITAPNNIVKCIPEIPFLSSGNNLFSFLKGNQSPSAEESAVPHLSFPKVRMTWTGNKIDLVEQVYAWETVGCFNHGNTNVKEIVAYIEIVFNIDLGNYYDTFADMRKRAKRTAFLDQLIEYLKNRMDEADRKK